VKRLFFLLLILLAILVFVGFRFAKDKVIRDLAQPVIEAVMTPTPTPHVDQNQPVKTSIIVPYWALIDQEESDTVYDQYIYFGIVPTTNGIAQEVGSQRVDAFIALVPQGRKRLLALRMVDSDTNASILKNKSAQQKIINQTVAFAKDHQFDGIVLDLEMSAIPFESLIQQINSFNSDLASAARKRQLSYTITLYGDTSYRLRPFDVKTLAKNADRVLMMAYDFNKSRANPGPNFPLGGNETYGYDISKMIDDILHFATPQKVSVIFGLFGYDWIVDNQGKAVAQGTPLTYLQIKQKFLDNCTFAECTIKRDAVSAETKISYIDADNKRHIVWFEDMQSVKTKETYLKTRGITNYSFWAYSYF
jgi:spore germination protein YaaH